MVLGIIPARSGSRGLKDKNILPLGDRTLLERAIDAAAGSSVLDDFIVTTDSEKYAAAARAAGAKVPFIRPPDLANDTATTVDVLKHAVEFYEKDKGVETTAIILLQPTTPLRNSEDVDGSYRLFASRAEVESLITCYEVEDVHPANMYTIEDGRGAHLMSEKFQGVRRQDYPKVYLRNGAVYISSRRLLMEENAIMGANPLVYVMPQWRSVNIDSLYDLELARMILEKPELRKG